MSPHRAHGIRPEVPPQPRHQIFRSIPPPWCDVVIVVTVSPLHQELLDIVNIARSIPSSQQSVTHLDYASQRPNSNTVEQRPCGRNSCAKSQKACKVMTL